MPGIRIKSESVRPNRAYSNRRVDCIDSLSGLVYGRPIAWTAFRVSFRRACLVACACCRWSVPRHSKFSLRLLTALGNVVEKSCTSSAFWWSAPRINYGVGRVGRGKGDLPAAKTLALGMSHGGGGTFSWWEDHCPFFFFALWV